MIYLRMFFLTFLCIHSTLAITLNLEEDGTAKYSLKDTSQYKKTKIDNDTITLEDADYSVELRFENDIFTVYNLKYKKEDNHPFSLTINSETTVHLGEEGNGADYRFNKIQLTSLIENKKTSFLNHFNIKTNIKRESGITEPIILKNVIFENYGKIEYKKIISPKSTLLLDEGSIFKNYGECIFEPEIHFSKTLKPAIFTLGETPENTLVNHGSIECKRTMYLSGTIFIDENGFFKGDTIYYEYKGTRTLKPVKRDTDSPIQLIARIKDETRNKGLAVGEFGEECAMDFYTGQNITAFSVKANRSDNGIDVWAFDEEKENLYVHESKNYLGNDFKLAEGQLTTTWCLKHFLGAFQTFLKEKYNRSRYGMESTSMDDETMDNLETALSIIVKAPWTALLNDPLNPDRKNDFKTIIGHKGENLENIFDTEKLIKQGNSIYYSSIPKNNNNREEEYEFMASPQTPSYFFLRNLNGIH